MQGKKKQNLAGFGSTYRKVSPEKKDDNQALYSVLGGQVWRIEPDSKETIANPCIWMQAGVVKHKSCKNYYNCSSCNFDQGMKKQVAMGKRESWQQAMRRQEPIFRLCRHSLTGRIGNRLCAYDYQCSTCDFDQYFEDYLAPKSSLGDFDIATIKGFALAENHYFHHGHTWARVEKGGNIRIGMDDFALKIFGKMDKFELPKIGHIVEHDLRAWEMKKKDMQSEVLSPLSGIVTEVNSDIFDKPGKVNEDPYAQGWFLVLHNSDIEQATQVLMHDEDSKNWLIKEANVLESMVEEVAGPLAADGGVWQEDILGNLPALGWSNLAKTFLKTG